MAMKMRRWRKRQRDLDQLLRYSDSDDDHQSVKLPNYPAPPKKSQPIQGTAVLDNAYLSGLVERASGSGGRETLTRSSDLPTPSSRHAARGHATNGYRSRSKSWRSDASSHTVGSGCDGSQHSDDSRHHHRSCTSRHHYRSYTSRHHHRPCTSRHHHRPCTSRHHHRPYTSRHHHRSCTSRHHHRSCTSRHHHRSRSNSDASRTPAKPRCDKRSRHSDRTSPHYHTPRNNAGTQSGKWTYPLPCGVFQKMVLSLLVDLYNHSKHAQPASSAVQDGDHGGF